MSDMDGSEMDEAEFEQELGGFGAEALLDLDGGPELEDMLLDEDFEDEFDSYTSGDAGADEDGALGDTDESWLTDGDSADVEDASDPGSGSADTADAEVSEPVDDSTEVDTSAEAAGTGGSADPAPESGSQVGPAAAAVAGDPDAFSEELFDGLLSDIGGMGLSTSASASAGDQTQAPRPQPSSSDTHPTTSSVVDDPTSATGAGETVATGYVTQYSKVRKNLVHRAEPGEVEPSPAMSKLLDHSRQTWRERPVSKLVTPVVHTLVILDEDSGRRPGDSVQVWVTEDGSDGADASGPVAESPFGDDPAPASSGTVWVAGQEGIDVHEPGQGEQPGPVQQGEQNGGVSAATVALAPAGPEQEPASAGMDEPEAPVAVPQETTESATEAASAPDTQEAQEAQMTQQRQVPEPRQQAQPAGPVDLAAAYTALDPLEQELLCDELGLAPAAEVAEIRGKARHLVGRLRGQMAELRGELAAATEQVTLLRAQLAVASAGGSGVAGDTGDTEGGMTGEVTGPADLPGPGGQDDVVAGTDVEASADTGHSEQDAARALLERQAAGEAARAADRDDSDHDGLG